MVWRLVLAPPIIPRRLRPYLLATVLLAVSPAGPALGAPEPLRSMTIPGHPGALAAAIGVDASKVHRARYLVELIRFVWENGPEFGQRVIEKRLVPQVRGIQRLRQRWFDALDRDNAISLAEAAKRRQVRAFLRGLGIEVVKKKQGNGFEAVVDRGPTATEARREVSGLNIDVEALAAELNSGASLTFTQPSFSVPLPLAPNVWTQEIFKRSIEPEWLFAAILADKRASLLYHGLLSLDAETLQYVAEHPSLLRRIAASRTDAFAMYGRSLHVRAGRITVPGAELNEKVVEEFWEDAVGCKVTEPALFIDAVLEADGGRFAYYYDLVAHLDRPHQRFALGTFATPTYFPDFKYTTRQLAQELRNVAVEAGDLDLASLPFSRPAHDSFAVLSRLSVTDEGRMRPPAEATLWKKVFPAVPQVSGPLAAHAVARLVLSGFRNERALRLRTLLFAQRVFGGARPEEEAAVVSALRLYGGHELLFQVLERIGVRTPATFTAAAGTADRVTAIDDERAALRALSLLQSGIALVDRCTFTGRLSPDEATLLLDSLFAMQPGEDRSYSRAVADWLQSALLPILGHSSGAAEGETRRERVLLEGLAGWKPLAGRAESFEWKDVVYRFDLGMSELDRLEQVRARQGGNSLDAVLAFYAAAMPLGPPRGAFAARQQALAAVVKQVAQLEDPRADQAAPGGKPERSLTARAAQLKSLLDRVQQPGDAGRLDVAAEIVLPLAAELLAATLRSIAYSVYLIDPESPALLDGDPAARHDFGLAEPTAAQRQVTVWRLAESVPQPWRQVGSLLALDVALWQFAVRTPSTEPPEAQSRMAQPDWETLAKTGALFNPYRVSNDETRQIAAAIDRGRLRVITATANPEAIQALALEAGLGEWEVRGLSWSPAGVVLSPLAAFSLSHLFRLGGGAAAVDETSGGSGIADRWGAFDKASGPLGLCRPPGVSWDTLSGRVGSGWLAAQTSDMTLRVALWLARNNLPAGLARDILPSAIQDLRDGARMAHADDWFALGRYATEYPDERLASTVDALASANAFTPLGEIRD
jgi:hypothetical protein